jgi:2-haloacid dehalogenase
MSLRRQILIAKENDTKIAKYIAYLGKLRLAQMSNINAGYLGAQCARQRRHFHVLICLLTHALPVPCARYVEVNGWHTLLSYFWPMPHAKPDTFLFDLAGVLIHWDAEPLYLQIFDGNRDAVRVFFERVFTAPHQNAISKGRPVLDVTRELIELHPEYRLALEAWWQRWPDLIDSLEDTVEITRRLRAGGHRTCILGNWGREEFDRATAIFEFLGEFDGTVISGDVGAMKPEPAIYQAAVERLGLVPERTLFVDDRCENVEAAKNYGFIGHVFHNAAGLEHCLRELCVEY